MQVKIISFVACFVLAVALLPTTDAQLQDESEGRPSANCQARYGNITAAPDEEEELTKLAKTLTTGEDATLSRVAAPSIRPGQCQLQKRSINIYRYLIINRRRVRCRARISLTNCLGYCRSYQSVSPYNGYVSKYCACCQAIRYQSITQYVTLYCNNCNYYRYRHTSIQPAQCSCRSC